MEEPLKGYEYSIPSWTVIQALVDQRLRPPAGCSSRAADFHSSRMPQSSGHRVVNYYHDTPRTTPVRQTTLCNHSVSTVIRIGIKSTGADTRILTISCRTACEANSRQLKNWGVVTSQVYSGPFSEARLDAQRNLTHVVQRLVRNSDVRPAVVIRKPELGQF